MANWRSTTEENLRYIYHQQESDYDMLREFIRINGFNRMLSSYYSDCVSIIRHGKVSSRIIRDRDENLAPYQDHCVFYKNTITGKYCLTYAPYEPIEDIREEVEAWAKRYGFAVDFYDPHRCWYSNSTCFVVIRLPDVTVKVPQA